MSLPNAAARGADAATLTNAINSLASSLGPLVSKTFNGNLSVGNLSPDTAINAASLTEVDFSLGTAPTGSAAQFDVLTSPDGVTFTSATGGAGVQIAAGQTAATLVLSAQPLTGSCLVRITVLAVGSSVAGANLTVTISGCLV